MSPTLTQMEELIDIDLATLKHAQLRTLCIQARDAGHLASHVNCNVNTSTIIARLRLVQDNLRQAKVESSEHTSLASSHRDVPTNPDDSHTSILSSLPYDVITLIASHMVSYSSVLAVLAANPRNTDLVRGLYRPRSPFWTKRLGNLTGKGPLTGPDGVTIATAAPWTPRDQHNALLPRGGFLINSLRRYKQNPDLVLAPTNIRVRQAFNMSPSRSNVTGTFMTVIVLALGEDGVLRYVIALEDIRYASDVGSRIEHARDILERGQWIPSRFVADNGSRMGEVLTIAPRINLIVRVGHDVVALDADGRLWVWHGQWLTTRDEIPSFVELVLPSSIVGREDRVRHIATAPAYLAIQGDLTEYEYTWHDTMLIITMEDGRDYIIDLGIMVLDSVLAVTRRTLIHPVPGVAYVALNIWVPSPPIDHDLREDGADYNHPLAPQMLTANAYHIDGSDIHYSYSTSDVAPIRGLLVDPYGTMITGTKGPATTAQASDMVAASGYKENALHRLAILPKWTLGSVGSPYWLHKMATWFPGEVSHIGYATDGDDNLYLLERDGTVLYINGNKEANRDPDDGLLGFHQLPDMSVDPTWAEWYGSNVDTSTNEDMVIFTAIGGLSGGTAAFWEGDWLGVGV